VSFPDVAIWHSTFSLNSCPLKLLSLTYWPQKAEVLFRFYFYECILYFIKCKNSFIGCQLFLKDFLKNLKNFLVRQIGRPVAALLGILSDQIRFFFYGTRTGFVLRYSDLGFIDLCVNNGRRHNLSSAFLKKDRNSDRWERI